MNNKNNSNDHTNGNARGIIWNPPGSDVTEENFDGGGEPGDSNLYLSSAERNSAVEISVGTSVSGSISEPGAEQFFKFTAPTQDVYSIFTAGDLDTIGYLYDSDGDLIILVDDLEIGSSENFNIIQTLGAGYTYYVKVGARSNGTGEYTLKVAPGRIANSVSIKPNEITLQRGVTYELPITPNYTYKGYNGAQAIPNLSVSVFPSDADNKKVWWWAESNSILECTSGWDDGDRYIHVTPIACGTAKLYAQDWNENGRRYECTVYVGGAPVSGISLNISEKNIPLKHTEQLIATITPENAINKGITWSSNNYNVVDVDNNGVITALKVGTAIVSATTDDGGYTASCIISVDEKEKVIVEKDSHSFHVKFIDGKVWKSIGIDLSNRQENYNSLNPPDMWYENYEYLIEEEQRFLDNYENFYSEKQFALLYLLDPFGVEYYLNQYNTTKYIEQFSENFENYNDKLRACLKFKDRIYKEIFGRSPTPFVLSDDGRRLNVTGVYDRIHVFTDSELIFGAHNITDMIDLLERSVDLIIELVDNILPDTTKNKWIMLGVNVAKTLLFSGSIVEALSDAASDFLNDYIEETSDEEIKIMEWPNPLLDNIYNFKKGIDEILILPNIHDIKICHKVNKQSNYNVEFSNDSSKMFVGEVIELCS